MLLEQFKRLRKPPLSWCCLILHILIVVTAANRFYDGMVKERSSIPMLGRPHSISTVKVPGIPWGNKKVLDSHSFSQYLLITHYVPSGKLCISLCISVQNRKKKTISWSLYFSRMRSYIHTYVHLYIVCPLVIRVMKKNKASGGDREPSMGYWFERLLFVIGCDDLWADSCL